MKPKRYIPDLQEMAALCEANYLRLMRLLPDEEDERTFFLSSGEHSAHIRLIIDEDHRYTTMISVEQQGFHPGWIQPLQMQVRLYHDAGMAEVTGYQKETRFEGHYQYPNTEMRLPDEKVQLNRFLAEWLSHCLRHGRSSSAITLHQGRLSVR